MSSAAYRLTRAADRDVAHILDESLRTCGPRQQDSYARIIESAVETLADDPDRPSARPRPDLGTGVRAYHLELTAGRRGAAAHVIYYIPSRELDGGGGVVILRILHESMEPARHLAGGFDAR